MLSLLDLHDASFLFTKLFHFKQKRLCHCTLNGKHDVPKQNQFGVKQGCATVLSPFAPLLGTFVIQTSVLQNLSKIYTGKLPPLFSVELERNFKHMPTDIKSPCIIPFEDGNS